MVFRWLGAISLNLTDARDTNAIGILPIAGNQIGERKIMLDTRSRLTLRIPSGDIARWLPSGKHWVSGPRFRGYPRFGLVPTTVPQSLSNYQEWSRPSTFRGRDSPTNGSEISGTHLIIGKRRTICITARGRRYEVVIRG